MVAYWSELEREGRDGANSSFDKLARLILRPSNLAGFRFSNVAERPLRVLKL
jgi:hypothetical protein